MKIKVIKCERDLGKAEKLFKRLEKRYETASPVARKRTMRKATCLGYQIKKYKEETCPSQSLRQTNAKAA